MLNAPKVSHSKGVEPNCMQHTLKNAGVHTSASEGTHFILFLHLDVLDQVPRRQGCRHARLRLLSSRVSTAVAHTSVVVKANIMTCSKCSPWAVRIDLVALAALAGLCAVACMISAPPRDSYARGQSCTDTATVAL